MNNCLLCAGIVSSMLTFERVHPGTVRNRYGYLDGTLPLSDTS